MDTNENAIETSDALPRVYVNIAMPPDVKKALDLLAGCQEPPVKTGPYCAWILTRHVRRIQARMSGGRRAS